MPVGALGVLGDLVEDVVVWLHEPLRRGSDTAVTLHRTRGGSAANVAALAAGLTPTRFFGCVGADPAGDAVVADLVGRGVDARVQRRDHTGTIVVLVDTDGERTMLPDRGASRLLAPVEEGDLDGLSHLHLTAYSLEDSPTAAAATAALEQVATAGGTTSLDASSAALLAGAGAERFAGAVGRLRPTFVLANATEAALLGLGADAPLPAWAEHAVVVVKDGARPTTVLRGGRAPLREPVPAVDDVRDATGAGDAFAAGFLASVLDGTELGAACRRGHTLAASTLRRPGASGPTAAE